MSIRIYKHGERPAGFIGIRVVRAFNEPTDNDISVFVYDQVAS